MFGLDRLMQTEFSLDRFASKCVAEFGGAAPFALRSGRAPTSELDARLCGEYAVSFVYGEFDLTVGETYRCFRAMWDGVHVVEYPARA